MQLDWMARRAVCTGESVNTIRRLRLAAPPIPDAHSWEQRWLEAVLLRNWIEATEQVFRERHGPVLSFMAATHPLPDRLHVTVLVPRLLAEVLRRMPGVGAHLGRDFLELRMPGPEDDVRARIRLCGISRRQGRELLAQVPESAEPVAPGRADPLLSGLLRRFPLWRTADSVSIRATGGLVGVYWRGGPRMEDVISVLTHSECGIPHVDNGESSPEGEHEIVLSDAVRNPRPTFEPWWNWTAIHTAQTTSPNPFAVAPRYRPKVPPEAWEDPEMRRALAAREIGAVYKFLRRRGVSEEQIAGLTGQAPSEVTEIIRGRQIMAYDTLVRIADGLRVPRAYLGLEYGDDPVDATSAENRKFLAELVATLGKRQEP